MDEIFTIIKQDLEVAKKGIEEDKLEFVSFVGNRIMMNLLVDDSVKLMALGFMIKELGGELRILRQNREELYISIKSESISYLNDLQELISNRTTDPKMYLSRFCDMEENLRRNLVSDIESSTYDRQSEFAKKFCIKLVDLFYSKKQDEIRTTKNMVSKTAFELSRNFNQHGGIEALVIYLVFRAFDDYLNQMISENDQEDRGKEIIKNEPKLLGYFDRIYQLKQFAPSLNQLYDESNLIIEDIGRDARVLYLSRGVQEKELILPENAKKKIDNIIKQSLLGDRKRKRSGK